MLQYWCPLFLAKFSVLVSHKVSPSFSPKIPWWIRFCSVRLLWHNVIFLDSTTYQGHITKKRQWYWGRSIEHMLCTNFDCTIFSCPLFPLTSVLNRYGCPLFPPKSPVLSLIDCPLLKIMRVFQGCSYKNMTDDFEPGKGWWPERGYLEISS